MNNVNNVATHGSCVQREWHHRKTPRAKFHDYSGGIYFVTVCTENKEHYFGKVVDGVMRLTELGNYTQTQLEDLHTHYRYAETLHFVVMPNHIHAIILIDDKIDAVAISDARTHEPCVPTFRTLLSVVIGGLKRAVTMYARRNNVDFGWQSRYHDHIVRNQDELNKISEYITSNPIVWGQDCLNESLTSHGQQ